MAARTLVDHIFFAFLLLVPLVEWKWSWPRHLAKLASGGLNIRLRYYRRLILGEWIPTVCLLAYWAWSSRRWAELGLAGDTPMALGLGFVYVMLLIGLLVWQRRALLRRPDSRARLIRALAYADPLLPHSQADRRLFRLVSLTAGVCEEIFYRGFLAWYLSAWMGPLAAVLMASLIFGVGHVYLGIAQVPKTALIGLILAIVVAITGSMYPAMLLHAAVDWNSGELGFWLMGDHSNKGTPAS
jgi:uncharacterized protein